MNKGKFMKMSHWSQLFFLAILVFGGFIIASLFTLVLAGGSIEKMQSIDFLRIAQLFQAVCLFLLPACVFAYLFQERPMSYLKINDAMNFKFLGYSLLLIIVIQPFISFTGYYNNLMTFPEFLSGVEHWMREMEDSTNALMEMLLTTNSISILLLNILVIAIVAGVTEEFFFRGIVQQVVKKICNNKHLAVWITAIIFSAIHFQFYGFLPRMILGATLGYIFLWSGNLWISVIAHTFNNFLAIMIFHFYHGTPQYEQAESFGATDDTLWITGLSFILSALILFFFSKESAKDISNSTSFSN